MTTGTAQGRHSRPNRKHQLPYPRKAAMPPAVLQFFRASQDANADNWAAASAEDGIFHDPVGQPPIFDRAIFQAQLSRYGETRSATAATGSREPGSPAGTAPS